MLLAGDLTMHGAPSRVRIWPTPPGHAEARCRPCSETTTGTRAHRRDLRRTRRGCAAAAHGNRGSRSRVRGGVVGTKGFVGGFAGSHLPDFGEPLCEGLRGGLRRGGGPGRGPEGLEVCELRIVLLHYAPTLETLEGEPAESRAFLGSDRLARPISDHAPDLVFHGHDTRAVSMAPSGACRCSTWRSR